MTGVYNYRLALWYHFLCAVISNRVAGLAMRIAFICGLLLHIHEPPMTDTYFASRNYRPTSDNRGTRIIFHINRASMAVWQIYSLVSQRAFKLKANCPDERRVADAVKHYCTCETTVKRRPIFLTINTKNAERLNERYYIQLYRGW